MNPFERMTDRANQCLALANQEALRLNHEYRGTEHILIGILKEGCGTAITIIKDLKVDPWVVRESVRAVVKSGPDMIQMGKLKFTPRAEIAMHLAMLSADEFKHEYICTDHLILGLLAEHDGVASEVMRSAGLTYAAVRAEVANIH